LLAYRLLRQLVLNVPDPVMITGGMRNIFTGRMMTLSFLSPQSDITTGLVLEGSAAIP